VRATVSHGVRAAYQNNIQIFKTKAAYSVLPEIIWSSIPPPSQHRSSPFLLHSMTQTCHNNAIEILSDLPTPSISSTALHPRFVIISSYPCQLKRERKKPLSTKAVARKSAALLLQSFLHSSSSTAELRPPSSRTLP
jgi:hypothetical protein